MRSPRPHLYFKDGMWHCRGNGQMLCIVGSTARHAFVRWSDLCRLLSSGKVL